MSPKTLENLRQSTAVSPGKEVRAGKEVSNRERAPIVLFGASVRAAAESARRSGFRVLGVDYYGDLDCREACDSFWLWEDAQCDHLESKRAMEVFLKGAVSIAVGGVEGSKMEAAMGAFSEIVRPLPDSSGLAEQLRQLTSIRTPESYDPVCCDPASLFDIGRRWLRKSRVRSGGLGVRWAAVASKMALPQDSSIFFERYIAGRRLGVSFLSDGQSLVLLGVCRSLHTRKGDLPFVYSGSFGPIRVEASMALQLQTFGRELIKRTGLRGLFGADVVVDRAGEIWLLEVNPRWTASSELIDRDFIARGILGAGESLMGCGLNAMLPSTTAKCPNVQELGERIGRSNKLPVAMLKKIIYAKKEECFDESQVRQSIAVKLRVEARRIELKDIPKEGTRIERGYPIATAILHSGISTA